MSVGNWQRNGHWIPLQFIIPNDQECANSPPVGTKNHEKQTVEIRGYTVPYSTSGRSVFVCGGLLRDGLQIRWLQTTAIHKHLLKSDFWTLENVSIRLLGCIKEYNLKHEERYVIVIIFSYQCFTLN